MLTTKTSFLNRLKLKTSRRVGAIATALLLVGSTSGWASATTAVHWIGQSVAMTATSQTADDRSVEKLLDLTPEKADALFALLAPQDIKVLVGRRNQGVHVRGTAKEVATLEALAELMMRESDREITDPQKFIEELEGTWDSASVYKLPKPAGEALLTVLAFPDVPVLVADQSDGIGVRASKRDQAVIADVARIQQGMEPTTMHELPERKVARDESKRRPGAERARDGRGDGNRRTEGRGRGDDRGDNRGGDDRRAGADRRGRELAEKVERLEERVQKLEELAAAIHSGEGHGHPGMHKNDKAKGKDKDKSKDSAKHASGQGVKKGDKAEKQKQQAAKNKDKKKNQKNEQDPNEVITMRYDLPAQHAENLFNLFAPEDVSDILVGRSGNTIEIRAARKYQRTIKQLVKMLVPDAKSEVTKKNQGQGQEQAG